MKHPARRFLTLLLALAFALPMVSAAFADDSTTTRGSASKDQNARTEMYVVTQTPGPDYPVFGAKNEPSGGVYYGRYTAGGRRSDGSWGLTNLDKMANESMVGHYLELNDTYGLEYWSYLFKEAIQDNNRAFLVSLNFIGEASDCSAVSNGSYDSKLTKDFQYLNTLTCPVFLRVGAEMNCWEPRPNAAEYKAAFQHIANLVRANAPRVAIVFSVNYQSGNNEDMDSYYPGNEYVDWVGCSLYYNRTEHGTYKNDKFLGVGTVYGDPLLNVQQTVNLAKLHNKPIILTEGGSFHSIKGNDYSAFASERMDRALSFLPMVYPQIKAIVTSNYDAGSQGNFDFEKNSTANAGYQHGASNNPTLRKTVNDTPSYYTKASVYGGAWEGVMKLAAYTYSADKLTATWSVDGQNKATVSEYPYAFQLDTSALSSGRHTVKVTFSNGQSKSQEFTSKANNANPTPDTLYVNGTVQTPTVYKINDNNYFKLRDVAMLLNGSEKQFSLAYDASVGAVQVVTGQPYTPDGSELAGQASGGKNAVASNDTLYINGAKADGLTVYQIDGNNYFKLRDLGQALDFYVGWDEATGSMIVSGNSGYQS